MKEITKANSYKAQTDGKLGSFFHKPGHSVNQMLYKFSYFQCHKLDTGILHVFFDSDPVCALQRLDE